MFNGQGEHGGLKTALTPAERWTYNRDMNVMVNEAGQTRPVTKEDGTPQPSASQAEDTKRNNRFLEAAGTARSLLLQRPTESGLGAAFDRAASVVGASPRGAAQADSLEAVSGWMVSNVPRMEGPQSDKDTQNYRVMAAQVGDRTVPVERRLAALQEVERLINKYSALNQGGAPAAQNQPNDDFQRAVQEEIKRRQSRGTTGGW